MPLTFRSLIVLAALLPASVATAGGIDGVARVIDGDTLEVGGQKIRLHGVDAPELDQTCTGPDGVWACGAFARDMLAGIVGDGRIDCRAEDTDRYGRIVAVDGNKLTVDFDKAGRKITLRHGEIKSLDMPPMTMVFQVSDPALLDKVSAGDKVRFRADQSGGNYRVTDLQRVP